MSVMMPAKDAASTLRSTIDSIQSQTYQDWELILIDDGSSDGTYDLAMSYAATDSRVKPSRIEHGGRGKARNACIERATGEFIAVCDADDISFPERFERQVTALRARPTLGVVGSWWIPFHGDNPNPDAAWGRMPVDPEDIAAKFRRGKMKMHNATVMMRASLFDQFGKYKVEQRRAQDYELFKRMANQGVQFANLPEPLLYYRQPGGVPTRSYFCESGLYMTYADATLSGYTGTFDEFWHSRSGLLWRQYYKLKYIYFYLKYRYVAV